MYFNKIKSNQRAKEIGETGKTIRGKRRKYGYEKRMFLTLKKEMQHR